MTIELTILLSVISVTIGVVVAFANFKRNHATDAKNSAAEMTTVIVKLENIGTGIAEIKNELSNIKVDVKDITERLVKVEESTKSAHRRLDDLIK